ncbi:alpha-amylase, partial [Vibrio parahaemolyticus]|nr:alpha-amylase [Vibrio parahaemolyticus]
FVMTDRFYNGNPDNDNSYGRNKDGKYEIGTFHGGDLAGLTKKLDYIESLGVNAIWITSPLEQIHGWVGGGDKGDFKHYGYHG